MQELCKLQAKVIWGILRKMRPVEVILFSILLGIVEGSSWDKFNGFYITNINFVKGNYTLSDSLKEGDAFKKYMEAQGFTSDEISSFQNHPTAGNFEIKLLSSKTQELEWITETPNGKHSIHLKRDHIQKAKLWNGKPIQALLKRVESRPGKNSGIVEIRLTADEYGCNWKHIFNETGGSIELSLSKKRGFSYFHAKLNFHRGFKILEATTEQSQLEEREVAWGDVQWGDSNVYDWNAESDNDLISDAQYHDFEELDARLQAEKPEKIDFRKEEGHYHMTTDKTRENVTTWMKNMGFSEENIDKFQKHADAGGFLFEVKENDEDDTIDQFQFVWETPIGKYHTHLKVKEESSEHTLWDGRFSSDVFKSMEKKEDGKYIHMEWRIFDRGIKTGAFQCDVSFRFKDKMASVKYQSCFKQGNQKEMVGMDVEFQFKKGLAFNSPFRNKPIG